MTQKRLGHVGGNDRFLVGDDVNVKQLEAHEVPLRKVFCSDYDFRIPEYQRPYSWGTEQACQLLEDLTEALDRGPDEPYFLGSVVLVKSSDETSADVIDGQQRLTTLTILLAVLRDLTVDPGLARELEVMLQEPGSKVQGLASKPRLTLRDRDSDFFRRVHPESRAAPGTLRTEVGILGDRCATVNTGQCESFMGVITISRRELPPRACATSRAKDVSRDRDHARSQQCSPHFLRHECARS